MSNTWKVILRNLLLVGALVYCALGGYYVGHKVGTVTTETECSRRIQVMGERYFDEWEVMCGPGTGPHLPHTIESQP